MTGLTSVSANHSFETPAAELTHQLGKPSRREGKNQSETPNSLPPAGAAFAV